MLVRCSLTGLHETVGTKYGSGQSTDPVGRTCMTGQRAQKEWEIKASDGRVETEAAVKRTQCYLMFAHLTTLSPSSPFFCLA